MTSIYYCYFKDDHGEIVIKTTNPEFVFFKLIDSVYQWGNNQLVITDRQFNRKYENAYESLYPLYRQFMKKSLIEREKVMCRPLDPIIRDTTKINIIKSMMKI